MKINPNSDTGSNLKLQEVQKMINCALESAEKGKHCCQINEDENCPTKKCSVKKTFGKNAENKKHWDETQKNQCEQMKDFINNKDTIEIDMIQSPISETESNHLGRRFKRRDNSLELAGKMTYAYDKERMRRFRNVESQVLSKQVDDEVPPCLDCQAIITYITDYLTECDKGVKLYIQNHDSKF